MDCADPECKAKVKGYDLEALNDDEDRPIWVIWYECLRGHKFVRHFDRKVREDKDG